MDTVDWLVVSGGIAVIAWVNWYFFVAQRTSVAAFVEASSEREASTRTTAADRGPEVTIVVKGGYDPAVIRVKAGQPVRLVFDRQETSGCSEEIVFPDFGVKRYLPAFRKTTVELTPPRPGKYGFTCGMSMLHGSLIAEE